MDVRPADEPRSTQKTSVVEFLRDLCRLRQYPLLTYRLHTSDVYTALYNIVVICHIW